MSTKQTTGNAQVRKKELSSTMEGIVRFFASGVAATISELSTLPIDITKVRLQTQKPLLDGTLKYTGQMACGKLISREEGFRALWNGGAPAVMRQFSYTGLSLVFYEPIRDFIAQGQSMDELPFWKRVLAGGVAGGSSIYLVNPTDVVKTRMQNSTVKLQIIPTAREVWARNGIRGFWAGASPNVARCFVGNACELGCYDQFKHMAIENLKMSGDSPLTHLVASSGAGLVSAIFSTPVDVIKTRLMAQAGTADQAYKGVVDAAINIPRNEGFMALYKGFWPLFQRKVFWTVIFFVCYERIRSNMQEAARNLN